MIGPTPFPHPYQLHGSNSTDTLLAHFLEGNSHPVDGRGLFVML